MSIGLACDTGGGFQQDPIFANTSRMVLTCPGSAWAQADDSSSSAAAKEVLDLRPGATAAHLMSDATCTFTILSGSVTLPLEDPGGAFFSLSTTSMPDTTSPITVYWPFRLGPSANMKKNCELAVSTLSPRHADDAALERHAGDLRLQIGVFRPAGAVEILAVAGLRHEAIHHAVEWHVVVIAFARQLLDPLGVFRREVGAQLEDDAALGGVDDDGILLVKIGRKRLRDGRRGANQGDDNS